MKPVVGLQCEPLVLLTLAGPCNLHDGGGAGAGKPHAYTYDPLPATAFYGIFCEDCVILPAQYPRMSFALRTLRRGQLNLLNLQLLPLVAGGCSPGHLRCLLEGEYQRWSSLSTW
jgi:hypothetical protein